MLTPARPQLLELLNAAADRSDTGPLTPTAATRAAEAAARQLGGRAPARLFACNVALGVLVAFAFGLLAVAGVLLRPPVLLAGVALVLVCVLVGVAFGLRMPGRVVLAASLMSLGGVGSMPFAVLDSRWRLREVLDRYLARRLTPAQLETFEVLAVDYVGSVRQLVVVCRSLA
jgi:hypothetical protein